MLAMTPSFSMLRVKRTAPCQRGFKRLGAGGQVGAGDHFAGAQHAQVVGLGWLAGDGHGGKPAEADYLRMLGASEVIASAAYLPAGTKPLEPALWQGAVDSLGGAPLAALTRSMQKDGVIASIGNAAGLDFNGSVFILRGVRLIGVNSDNEPELRDRIWKRLGSDLRPRHLAQIAR